MSKSLDSEYLHFVDEASKQLFEKFKSDEKSTKFAGNFLAGEGGYVTRGIIDKARFNEAISSDGYESLRDVFLQIPRESIFSLCSLNEVKVVASKSSQISGENHDQSIDHLKQTVGVEDQYDGICVVEAKGDIREIGSENSDKPFSLYSIGKVFTGVLVLEMVARGIIPESDLTTTGLQLDEDVKKTLRDKLPKVSKRVDEVTLHQAMIHRAGFDDYLENYDDAIKSGVEAGEIPNPSNPRDFLAYANDEVKDNKGGTKKSYSNTGILLAGLVAEHYYNRGKPESEQKSYNEILQELVLEPAGITSFSITPPDGALINTASKTQPYGCGSPAGGYWETAHDMQNFAKHLCSRMQDERFRGAIENYGQEFYDKEKQVISHAGDIGAEGSSWFSVHIPSGTSCVMAQNSCFARMTGEQVSMVIASEQEREKSGASITSSPIEILRDKYLPLIAQACLEKFSTGSDYQNFKNFLTGVTGVTSQEIDEAITSKDLTKFTKIFESISLSNLIAINGGEGLDLIKQDDLSDLKKNTKTFFKVTFDENLTPTLTALDQDKIWSEEGLDRTQPFIVINPGNGPTNLTNLAVSSEQEAQKYVISEAKVFEKGVRKCDLPETGRQYLVTVNEEVGQPNMDLIRSHNANPEGFTTPYTKEQARLIYGPLITENGITPDGQGTPLSDQEIVQNLSNARSYNASLGSVIANCQTNALVLIMRDLGISEETIKDGVESMRRLDGPNMAATSSGISQSTAIFEGANDKLAEDFIGGRRPALPADHDHTSVVPIDDHRIKIYQTLPIEVYHPGKKPTEEQRQQEDKIVQGLPRIKTLEEIRALGRGDETRQAATKSKAQDSFETRKENVLKYMGLDGFRFKDRNIHNAPHLTMAATPGNEVVGRDQDLLYKLMADMMTRENPRDVSHYFDQQKEISTQTASNDSNQTTDQKWSEKYPSKKSAEAEDLIEQKNSWKEILKTTGKSKDDSTITR